ncbi:MAG: DEAD/DEAH box helicase [Bacteroidetes bacterium]|nr:DEAD/DEAH box helicase [Bacteroidota bacterium]
MTFKELNIIAPILQALEAQQYTHPTPIQQQAIPHIAAGRDLLGCAQTGTGKTAAFAIPILQLLNSRPAKAPNAIRTLILTPTRELALQIDESFAAYGSKLRIRHTAIFGGVPQGRQVETLKRGVDVLIATPGRLLDLMGQRFINIGNIEIFVLDEADRMLDMGFVHDVKKVVAKLPAKRQTLFFSATMPPEIQALANTILVDPAEVKVTPVSSTAKTVQQSLYFVDKKQKKDLLIHILRDPAISRSLVFTRTKHGADKLVKDLHKSGINAAAIHGNKSQSARQRALSDFKNSSIRVLVATDIAARGIDIDELPYVINYELPEVPETYVHRIGRTGRAGASGIAISFCDAEEMADLRGIQKLIGFNVPVVSEHPFLPTHATTEKQKTGNAIQHIHGRQHTPQRQGQKNNTEGRKQSPNQVKPQRPQQHQERPARHGADRREQHNRPKRQGETRGAEGKKQTSNNVQVQRPQQQRETSSGNDADLSW